MGRKPLEDKRVPLNRLVAGATPPLVKSLAGQLGVSEGRVIDHAIQMLAVAESFGVLAIRTTPETKVTGERAKHGAEDRGELYVTPRRFTPPTTNILQRKR